MDPKRFDSLAKSLVSSSSRRSVVKSLLGGAAAAVGVVLGQGAVTAAPKNKACNVGCASLKGQQKNACMKACRECNGDFDRVCFEEGPFGPVAFTCCPTGSFCLFGEGICCEAGTDPCFDDQGNVTCCPSGTFCNFEVGECQPFVTCTDCTGNPCGLDPIAVCGSNPETGQCLCAETGDAICTCVQPICGDACDADGLCADGFACINVECCGAPTCAPLCETPLGAGAARVRRWDST